MNLAAILLLAIPLVALGVFVLIYNALVQGRNHCDEAWADIDAELKRRYDLIPNLVRTVQGYAKHEREVLDSVSRARASAMANNGSPTSQARDENQLIRGLRQLLAVAENYPDLKANQNFLALQTELANTEDRIQRSRRFYNANVRDYLNRLQVFPSNLVAGVFHFPPREFFEIEDASERAAPVVQPA
jgi:LemA protein